jgi:hypothetical protein
MVQAEEVKKNPSTKISVKTTLLVPTLNEIEGMKVIMPQIEKNGSMKL